MILSEVKWMYTICLLRPLSLSSDVHIYSKKLSVHSLGWLSRLALLDGLQNTSHVSTIKLKMGVMMELHHGTRFAKFNALYIYLIT